PTPSGGQRRRGQEQEQERDEEPCDASPGCRHDRLRWKCRELRTGCQTREEPPAFRRWRSVTISVVSWSAMPMPHTMPPMRSMTRADVARTMPTMPPRVLSKSERLLHAKHAVGREPLDARLAAQGHVPPQLVAQDVERVVHALGAAGGQPPERRASDGHHARPPREPFQHGGTAAEPAVDDD